MQIAPNTPITDAACPVCGGDMTITTNPRAGNRNAVARCSNKLSNGTVCGSWFTAGANATYLLKQNFLKALKESQANDNEETAEEATEESTISSTDGSGTADTGNGSDAANDNDTGGEKQTRKRRSFFKR